jgi:LPXTG-site transpeptidase (sortase) family protein
VVLGLGVFTVAGIVVARDRLSTSPVVLVADPAIGETPDTIPVDAAAVERSTPRAIRIADLSLDYPVRSVGIDDSGELEVPDATEVGWYEYGSAPGLPGSTVLAAHVSWNRAVGPFYELGTLEPGARVEVEAGDGSTRTYAVVERAIYDKDELPRDRIWRTTGDETLVLITCGGDFNADIRRFRQNIVIYAVPVATDTPTGSL